MYIFACIAIIMIIQFLTNKLLKISINNNLSYTYSKRDTFIIIGCIVISIILQKVMPKGDIYWIGLGVFAFIIFVTMIILGTIKRILVIKQREEILSVFEVLEPVIPNEAKVKNKETQEVEMKDINNPPFKLGYEGNNINKITIKINPNTFKEPVAVNLCLSLNKYLPNYEWVNEFDFAARECSFVGTPLPPKVAKYMGSWLRPTEFIPIGLSGLGEVSWNLNSFKNEGRSCYVYEDGKIAKTVDTPPAPQSLCVGSPLGLNTVVPTTRGYKTIETITAGDEVFDINNKPVKVLGKSEVFTGHKVYRLEFLDQAFHPESMTIISDEIHKFPVIKDTFNYEETMTKDMNIGDYILDRNANGFQLFKKELIESEPVQCILVDSDSHLFLITDEIDNNWKGGNSYPYKAIYTRNTGGGKAIYINQTVEVQSRDMQNL